MELAASRISLVKMSRISFFKKLLACLIGGLIAAVASQRIIFRTVWEFKNKWIPPPVFVIIPVILVLLTALLYSFAWQQQESKGKINSSRVLAFWQAVIRCFIAIDLSMIGWQKLFHLQFSTPLGILDEPFSSFSGEALTWAYFGYSYAFTVVIGLLQIAGSYLLLFKRTRLFGAVIIFPVLLNIILIDLFYKLQPGELGHAIILMIGILYLLMQERDRLVQFFFYAKSNLPVIDFKNKLFKNAVRASVILIPLVLILSYGSPDKNPGLTGKYHVQRLLVNQKEIIVSSCQDSVLTTVYFDKGNDIVFEYNNQKRRMIGTYEFNPANKILKATWRYPLAAKDTLAAMLSQTEGKDQLSLTGRFGIDSLQLILVKTN